MNTIERSNLIAQHRKERDKRLADRIKVILWLDRGFTYEEIAKLLYLDDSTIREEIFKKDGIEALLDLNYKGRISRLNDHQKIELKEHLIKYIYLSSKAVLTYVKEKYNIDYKESGMTLLLHSLGFEYKKPKLVPGKINKEEQEKFIEKYEVLKNRPDSEILFMDATHPQHNSKPAFGWFLKKSEIQLQTNTGRKRINLNGVLNIKTKEVIIRRDVTINADSTIELIKELEEKYPLKDLFIICDNARYYRSKKLKEYLKHKNRINLVFLPPYCPNLNLIERVWRFFHRKVTALKYYSSFLEFEKSVLNFFSSIKDFKGELSSLLREKFQIITPNFSKIQIA
jgi:transposase